MAHNKVKRNFLRQRAAAKGIFSIAELSRRIGCSRPVIYFAIENPGRYPLVNQRIQKLIGTIHD